MKSRVWYLLVNILVRSQGCGNYWLIYWLRSQGCGIYWLIYWLRSQGFPPAVISYTVYIRGGNNLPKEIYSLYSLYPPSITNTRKE